MPKTSEASPAAQFITFHSTSAMMEGISQNVKWCTWLGTLPSVNQETSRYHYDDSIINRYEIPRLVIDNLEMNWGDPAAKHAHLVDAKGQVPLSDVRDSMSSFSFTSSGNPGFVAGNYKYVYIKDLGDLHERVNRLVSTENENTPDGQITLMFGSIFGSTTGARNGLIASYPLRQEGGITVQESLAGVHHRWAMRTADVNNPPEDKQVFFVERLDAIPTGGKDLLARAKPVLLVLYAGQAMYPGNVLVLQNIKGDPRSSSKTRIRLSLHGITYIYELFLDGNEARLSTLIQAKKTRGEAPLVVDRAGLPAAYEAKAETWEWLARKPIPTGSTTYRWSRAHVITRDAFRVGNTVADVMIDKQDGTGPVKTAITFQEWVRCHGIKESAALSWSQAQLLECFLIFANGDVMASPLPWMVDVTGMLVPGRSTFGWVSPTTVDELLPEWFRESNTNIISKSITDVEAWQATWLDCINKSPTRTPALFKHLPDWFT